LEIFQPFFISINFHCHSIHYSPFTIHYSLNNQYAPIIHRFDNLGTPLTYKGKYVNNGKIYYELDLPGKEKERIVHIIDTNMNKIVKRTQNHVLRVNDDKYIYEFINKYPNDYIFIGKEAIDGIMYKP